MSLKYLPNNPNQPYLNHDAHASWFSFAHFQEKRMLETYLTVKTIIMLFGLAFLLLYFILCGIAIIPAIMEYRECRKMMRQIKHEEHPKQ